MNSTFSFITFLYCYRVDLFVTTWYSLLFFLIFHYIYLLLLLLPSIMMTYFSFLLVPVIILPFLLFAPSLYGTVSYTWEQGCIDIRYALIPFLRRHELDPSRQNSFGRIGYIFSYISCISFTFVASTQNNIRTDMFRVCFVISSK